jgi:hypothetical protein
MIRRGWMVAILVCLAAAFAIAATQKSAVDGSWQGRMATANGPLTVTYHFTTKGQVLTGSCQLDALESESLQYPLPKGPQPISEGKVNGGKISFKTTAPGGGSMEHEGTVSGDTIQLKNIGRGGEFDITLKRISSKKKPVQ